jgi:thiamine biosynthesis protein ThiS
MIVHVNETPTELPAGSTVADLLLHLGLPPARSAVERNRHLIRRADQASTLLVDGDRLEVVTLVGGG